MTTSRYIVDAATGCWIWQGAKTWNGYGKLSHKGRQLRAHRYFYELARGPIPAGLDLDHLCRTRACVNPDHLEPVTRGENVRRGALAKFDMATAAALRLEYSTTNVSQRQLARRFGVSQAAMQRLLTGQTYPPQPARP